MVIQIIKPSRSYYANLLVHNSKGEVIFFTSDNDLTESFIGNGNKKGIYQYRIKIPGKILKPGLYSISPAIGYHIDNDHEHELWFEIIDVISRRAAQTGGYRDSLIAPEIEWKGEMLSNEDMPEGREETTMIIQ
jgi:hypothetical protein